MASADNKEVVPAVTAGEARALVSSGGHGSYLDVRTWEDFDKGHAASARNVPYYLSITPHEVAALYGKDEHLVVGCRTGVRSKLATSDLVNAGFKNARTLQGGYLAFLQSASGEQQQQQQQQQSRPWAIERARNDG